MPKYTFKREIVTETIEFDEVPTPCEQGCGPCCSEDDFVDCSPITREQSDDLGRRLHESAEKVRRGEIFNEPTQRGNVDPNFVNPAARLLRDLGLLSW